MTPRSKLRGNIEIITIATFARCSLKDHTVGLYWKRSRIIYAAMDGIKINTTEESS